MTKEEETELEEFIKDWHWDVQSHTFAIEIGEFLFKFIDKLYSSRLKHKTILKHIENCWSIGKLECDYGYLKSFSPEKVFYSINASYMYEFKRKFGNSNYAVNSYKSTWKKLYKYTKALDGKTHTEGTQHFA